MAELLTRTIDLACPVDHAFEVFTQKIDLWWPRGHRRHREGALQLDLGRGALIDRAPDGSEWTMAEITGFEPPALLALDWFPGSPAAPTSVEVRFTGLAERTKIVVTHRPLLETKSIWPQRVELFTRGWEAVLPALKTFIEAAEA